MLRALGGVSSPIQSACAGERRETIGMVIDRTTCCFFYKAKERARCNECKDKIKLKEKAKVKVKGASTRVFFAFDFAKAHSHGRKNR